MRAFSPTLFAVFALVLAGTAAAAETKPNPNRGKSRFIASCKVCHAKGGEAKLVTPLTKTQAQWQRFFRSAASACVKRAAAKTGKALEPQDLADMQAFLVAHAADSDQPETCGQ